MDGWEILRIYSIILYLLFVSFLVFLTRSIYKDMPIPVFVGFGTLLLALAFLSTLFSMRKSPDGQELKDFDKKKYYAMIAYNIVNAVVLLYISFMILSRKHIPKNVAIVPGFIVLILAGAFIIGVYNSLMGK